ncbi:MAG: methylmalonyl-CoA mutase [Calditrichaeota bacterium]|nr:MAG: methylmalonyl-CoA mutase [Calditrichota bacterium]
MMSIERRETDSGIPIKPVYDETDLPAEGLELGAPGEYPFTRGVYPTMYRQRLWTMRQYGGYASARESNKRFHYLLQQGQTGLSVAFDLPTQMGYDSDHPMAEGEVGKVGVPIDSIHDMETLFEGIQLEEITTSMTINATAAILLAMYVEVARKQGADLQRLSGTVQNDILKEFVARATYIFPPKPSMRLVTDVIEWCAQSLPRWNSISISGYHIREAGSNAVQELAFTLANAIEYVQAAVNRGLNVDQFAARLSFFFNSHNYFFEEIAKFRAARRMWAKIMKQRFGAKNPRSMMLRFHTQTAGSTLTAQQIDNNIIRVTLQALAAVLGGTQSLHTNSRDEALALPAEDSVRIALRTQQIIAYESGVPDTADPLAGSFYVENLTNEIEKRARAYLQEIEERGGAIACIEKGYFQQQIAESAYAYQKAVEAGEKVIVGVNAFQIEEEKKIETLHIDEKVREEQVQKLKKLKAHRDNSKVEQLRQQLARAAKTDENLMPYILECVSNEVTLGEISDTLRQVFGVYQER